MGQLVAGDLALGFVLAFHFLAQRRAIFVVCLLLPFRKACGPTFDYYLAVFIYGQSLNLESKVKKIVTKEMKKVPKLMDDLASFSLR